MNENIKSILTKALLEVAIKIENKDLNHEAYGVSIKFYDKQGDWSEIFVPILDKTDKLSDNMKFLSGKGIEPQKF